MRTYSRRALLARLAAMPLLGSCTTERPTIPLGVDTQASYRRRRPGDADWPAESDWSEAGHFIHGFESVWLPRSQ